MAAPSRFNRHDATDPHSLSDNYIIAQAADAEGGLWIATQSGGLNHLDPISGPNDSLPATRR